MGRGGGTGGCGCGGRRLAHVPVVDVLVERVYARGHRHEILQIRGRADVPRRDVPVSRFRVRGVGAPIDQCFLQRAPAHKGSRRSGSRRGAATTAPAAHGVSGEGRYVIAATPAVLVALEGVPRASTALPRFDRVRGQQTGHCPRHLGFKPQIATVTSVAPSSRSVHCDGDV